MLPDLHTHTSSSDGELTPSELLARAARNGVRQLSITDHDTVSAYQELAGQDQGMPVIIPGIEFSTTWNNRGIHILGLNIDIDSNDLLTGIARQQQNRLDRAEKIALRLKRCGVSELFEKALAKADGGTIGRPHFAQVLLDEGTVSSRKEAFRKFLGAGKAGDVRQYWAELRQVVDWIVSAGGTAVLAHPTHYRLTNRKLFQLGREFVAAGGSGIEVCNGVQTADTTSRLGQLCTELKLHASCGSDFHGGDETWSQPGRFSPLPPDCKPVWDLW